VALGGMLCSRAERPPPSTKQTYNSWGDSFRASAATQECGPVAQETVNTERCDERTETSTGCSPRDTWTHKGREKHELHWLIILQVNMRERLKARITKSGMERP
jgi:hypothetical protein